MIYVSFYFGNHYIFSTSITITISLKIKVSSLFLGNNGVLCLLCDNVVALNNYWSLFRGSSGANIGGVISGHFRLPRYEPITVIVVQINNAYKGTAVTVLTIFTALNLLCNISM